MKMKLDHIGLVVARTEEFERLFRLLGLADITEPAIDPIQRVSGTFVRVTEKDPVYIELLEATEEVGPIVNFLKKRGGGLHHLCFEVDNIEKAVDHAREQGFTIISPPVPCPAYDNNFHRECRNHSRVAFFLLSKTLLCEFIEKGT